MVLRACTAQTTPWAASALGSDATAAGCGEPESRRAMSGRSEMADGWVGRSEAPPCLRTDAAPYLLNVETSVLA